MYSRAIKGGRQRVIYIEGKDRLVKIGGDPAWRNNNPGNLKSGAHTRIRRSEWSTMSHIDLTDGRNFADLKRDTESNAILIAPIKRRQPSPTKRTITSCSA